MRAKLHKSRSTRFSLMFTGLFLALIIAVIGLPAMSQEAQNFFPTEDFIQINPTVPNSQLNFEDDSNESCCAKDYAAGSTQRKAGYDAVVMMARKSDKPAKPTVAKSEFEKAYPAYSDSTVNRFLVECDKYADYPVPVANTSETASTRLSGKNLLPITSYSTNVSRRTNAEYFTDPKMVNTSNFHIETAGGLGLVKLQDVNNYSVCMARGGNVAMVANTDNGSVITYNGNDHIYLAGNNTNMLTRTGAGEDMIELYQAHSKTGNSAEWSAYNVYKTALSGSDGTDTLVIRGTPPGTKWCHIGAYKIYGELFYVVEFALPPSVTEGPRRQQINIGKSVEYVVFKGRTYKLNDFLVHGSPADTVALSTPIGDALPHVR